MTARINVWDKISILLSVLIFATAVGESFYRDQYMMRSFSNFALVQKTDIIHLAVIPLVSAGAILQDASILKQAYYLHLIGTGESHEEASSKLQDLNTLEDYYRLVPVHKTVENSNRDILRSFHISWFFNKFYITLSVVLILIQFYSLRVRIRDNKSSNS